MFDKLSAKDVIAILVVIGGMILIGLGIDKIIGGILVMVATHYFSSDHRKPIKTNNG